MNKTLSHYDHCDTRSRHLQFNFKLFTFYSLTFFLKYGIIIIENKNLERVERGNTMRIKLFIIIWSNDGDFGHLDTYFSYEEAELRVEIEKREDKKKGYNYIYKIIEL